MNEGEQLVLNQLFNHFRCCVEHMSFQVLSDDQMLQVSLLLSTKLTSLDNGLDC